MLKQLLKIPYVAAVLFSCCFISYGVCSMFSTFDLNKWEYYTFVANVFIIAVLLGVFGLLGVFKPIIDE